MRGERGSGRENRDFHLVHRGRSRWFSFSPDVRYVGGERVPSRVPPYGGDRGEWTVARPRRRKVLEQAVGQRDRFQAVQRRGRGWEDHQRRRSRVNVQRGSELRYSDVENLTEFEPPVQTYDRKTTLQYSRSGCHVRRMTQRLSEEPDGYCSKSFYREKQE